MLAGLSLFFISVTGNTKNTSERTVKNDEKVGIVLISITHYTKIFKVKII